LVIQPFCNYLELLETLEFNNIATFMKTMMVMGDSLGQGCRNLTVTRENCSRAYGTVISPRIGCGKLRTATYAEKPVLFDLLEELRRIDIDIVAYIPQLLSKVQRNARFWAGTAWMQPKSVVHDNVAITGANYEDLFETKASGFREEVVRLAALINKDALALFKDSNFSKLHRNITAMYAVNPCGNNRKDYWEKTAFDIVKERKPDYLFVDIGHNSGDSCFFGSGSDALPLGQKGAFDPELYVRRMQLVFGRLEELATSSPDTQVFFSVLPKMSAVAALAPLGSFNQDDGYWDGYEPTLSTSSSFLTKKQMMELDEAVRDANSQVIANAKPLKAFLQIFDAYGFFDGVDYKNSLDDNKQIFDGTHRLDNRYVEGINIRVPKPISSKPRDTWKCVFAKGGFEGMDGMHPSAVGYAQYAISILENELKVTLTEKEKETILADAFEGDTLLSDFPFNLAPVLGLLKAVRGGGVETISGKDVPIGVAVSALAQHFSNQPSMYLGKVVRKTKLAAKRKSSSRRR
jgi:hypothetical protein